MEGSGQEHQAQWLFYIDSKVMFASQWWFIYGYLFIFVFVYFLWLWLFYIASKVMFASQLDIHCSGFFLRMWRPFSLPLVDILSKCQKGDQG